MKYLLNIPSITKLEKKYVNDVLNKGWLSAEGEHTKIFEKKLSKLLTVKYGFAVQSGTAALHTALKTLGVNPIRYLIEFLLFSFCTLINSKVFRCSLFKSIFNCLI